MNRKRSTTRINLFVVLAIAAIGILSACANNDTPKTQQKLLIADLGYCNSQNTKPCIVSFSLDTNGNMLINLITPSASYPDFYLTINKNGLVTRYDCQKVEDFPTNVYCTGKQMFPGETLQFSLIAIEDDTVLAEGSFSIIGLLVSTSGADTATTATMTPLVTATATLSPVPGAPTLTPVPTLRIIPTRTSSYPNRSYP